MSITRVAQLANVPYATAWRIINNQPCGSEQAVEAVQAAMQRVGYTPGSAKRGRPPKSMNGIRTHNVALLNLRDNTPISASILSGVQSFLAERNLNLIYGHVDNPDALPQAVRAGNVDGILGYGEFPESAITPSLRRVPAVWLMSRGGGSSDPWGDRIKPDHPAIGRLAAEYLLARGHRHVGYFNPSATQSIYSERGEWFHHAIGDRAQSLAFLVAPRRTSSTPGQEWLNAAAVACVEQWLVASPRPTGIFCPVDQLTLRVYSQLMRRGIRPGRDVEIVSCDNQPELLSLIDPPPASIDLNRNTIARLAVERLLWRMRNGMASPSVMVTVSPTLDFKPDFSPAAGGDSATPGATPDSEKPGPSV